MTACRSHTYELPDRRQDTSLGSEPFDWLTSISSGNRKIHCSRYIPQPRIVPERNNWLSVWLPPVLPAGDPTPSIRLRDVHRMTRVYPDLDDNQADGALFKMYACLLLADACTSPIRAARSRSNIVAAVSRVGALCRRRLSVSTRVAVRGGGKLRSSRSRRFGVSS